MSEQVVVEGVGQILAKFFEEKGGEVYYLNDMGDIVSIMAKGIEKFTIPEFREWAKEKDGIPIAYAKIISVEVRDGKLDLWVWVYIGDDHYDI
jgi:hypothetical protein